MENKIQEIQNKNQRKNDDFNKIVEFVAGYFSISVYDIKSDSRKKEVSSARQMLMYIAKKYF
ncbi:MAG: helix-turn-helix domain-containing protein [Patescibacteria group bacterium]